MSTEPTDIPELDDLSGYGELDTAALHTVATDPPTFVREPIPLRETTGHATQADVIGAAMDRIQGAIATGTTQAHRDEDLDHAAQAIVDAADEWEANLPRALEQTHALVGAVQTWRGIRDGATS